MSTGNSGRRKAEYWWLISESLPALLTLGLSKSKQELRFAWGSGPLLKETTHEDLETNFVTLSASFVLQFYHLTRRNLSLRDH